MIEFKHNRPGIGERAPSEGCRTIALLYLQGLALPQEFDNVIRFLLFVNELEQLDRDILETGGRGSLKEWRKSTQLIRKNERERGVLRRR